MASVGTSRGAPPALAAILCHALHTVIGAVANRASVAHASLAECSVAFIALRNTGATIAVIVAATLADGHTPRTKHIVVVYRACCAGISMSHVLVHVFAA